MAGAGGVELCVAAIAGGALGSLPCAMLTPDQVASPGRDSPRPQARGPLNLNFFCHRMPDRRRRPRLARAAPALLRRISASEPGNGGALRLPFDADMCAVVEELKPEVVSFHFGLPEAPLLERVKASGAPVIGNATTVAEAHWLEERGRRRDHRPGLRGRRAYRPLPRSDPAEALGLFALLPQVADAVSRAGHCRRRNRRRARDRGCLDARRERGSARHRLSAFARELRSATRTAPLCAAGRPCSPTS